MERKFNLEAEGDSLQTKQDVINGVKSQFYKKVMSKLGDLLLKGISEFLGIENSTSNHIKFIKLPLFLKPFLFFFKNKQLLIETSLLYISNCLGLMTEQMQEAYDDNLAKIETKRESFLEMKDLFWVNSQIDANFPCRFDLPQYLSLIYPYLEEEIQNLVTFGMLKILEWLGLLNNWAYSVVPMYEQSYTKVFQALPLAGKK